MDTNKILSASILDLVFDNRNKEYGAYELRNTYSKRITKALIITASISLLIFAGTVLGNPSKSGNNNRILSRTIDLSAIPDETKPELPKPEKKQTPVQTRTEIFTPPAIVDKVDKPLPTQEDLDHAIIDVVKHEGIDPDGINNGKMQGDDKGIIETKKIAEPEVWEKVEVDAKFTGNWEKFLLKNLDANVPADNGAPAGNHTIIIQFVVDVDGNISDIKPLTNLGYGMEQEAIRVLIKATKWEPAIQNGRPVKAYRRQPITFQVLAE
jgi:protein TonB